jgi:hypothetical protein
MIAPVVPNPEPSMQPRITRFAVAAALLAASVAAHALDKVVFATN